MSTLGIVNVAVQVLPMQAGKHPYVIVDKAIETIQKAGLKYEVCPFETVIEGPYDEVMAVVRDLQEACIQEGTANLITNLKIQVSADKVVKMTDKTDKYR